MVVKWRQEIQTKEKGGDGEKLKREGKKRRERKRMEGKKEEEEEWIKVKINSSTGVSLPLVCVYSVMLKIESRVLYVLN